MCGRALREEPTYPWGWLEAAKLRAHFGDAEGALKAIETGLALVPGDPSSSRHAERLSRGATFFQLSNHLIDPDADEALQRNQMPSDELLVYTRFNNCILAKPDGLEAVLRSLTSVTGSLRILLKYLLHGHLFGGWVPAGLSVLNECSGAFTRLCWMARRCNPCSSAAAQGP